MLRFISLPPWSDRPYVTPQLTSDLGSQSAIFCHCDQQNNSILSFHMLWLKSHHAMCFKGGIEVINYKFMIGALPKPVSIKTAHTFLTARPRISLHTWADVISYTVSTVLAWWAAHGWKKEKHIKVQHLMNENHTCVLWTDDGHIKQP